MARHTSGPPPNRGGIVNATHPAGSPTGDTSARIADVTDLDTYRQWRGGWRGPPAGDERPTPIPQGVHVPIADGALCARCGDSIDHPQHWPRPEGGEPMRGAARLARLARHVAAVGTHCSGCERHPLGAHVEDQREDALG